MISVYEALVAAGQPAVMASHGGAYEFLLDRSQIPWERIRPATTVERSLQMLSTIANPNKPAYTYDELEQHVRCEIKFFRERAARAVVSGFALSAALSARGAGIPLIVTHIGSFTPLLAEQGRLVCRDAFENGITWLIPGGWLDRFINWFFPRTRMQIKTFNRVAKVLDIEPVRGTFDLLLGDLSLVTDVPEILGISEETLEAWRPSPRHRLRPTLRLKYAGPIFAKLADSIPADVEVFLNTPRPKVYAALTSTQPEHIARVHATLAEMDVAAIIVSTVNEAGVVPPADNILVKDFLPSHLVMPRCDIAIIHGGQGSIQTAIASGTPLIGFPLQPEQNFNLRLVEGHGGGRTMSLWKLKKGRLRDVIEEVPDNPECRAAMAQLKAFQATRDGPAEVARILSEQLAG
jgi:UDP:flavonoid glycosyltransferase YjiC (YdhE family)